MRLYLLLLASVRSFEKGGFSGDERVDKKELRRLIEEILEEKQLEQRVEKLDTQFNETLSLADERFMLNLEKAESDFFRQEQLEQRFEAIEWAILEWEKKMKGWSFDDRLLDVERSIHNLTLTIGDLSNSSDSIDLSAEISDQLKDVETDVQYLLENYRSIQSVVSDNSKQLNDLSTELDILREEVDSEDYEESIDELNEKTINNSNNVTSLWAASNDLSSTLSELQDQISKLSVPQDYSDVDELIIEFDSFKKSSDEFETEQENRIQKLEKNFDINTNGLDSLNIKIESCLDQTESNTQRIADLQTDVKKLSVKNEVSKPSSDGPLNKTCKMRCTVKPSGEQRCYFDNCGLGEQGDSCQMNEDCQDDLVCDKGVQRCALERSSYLMIGGKQPSNSGSATFPQFEIALIELVNDQIKKTLLSSKTDRMRPGMPKTGFFRHCTAKLGKYFYIIGGGQPANRIYKLDLNMASPTLTQTNIMLPHDFYMHSCATFQDKIWICAPFVRSNKNLMKNCWTFDGSSVQGADGLSVGHYSSKLAKIVVEGEEHGMAIVGGQKPRTNKAEYHGKSGGWVSMPSLPVQVSSSQIVWNPDTLELFVFGGYRSTSNRGGGSSNDVYKIKYLGNDQWDSQWSKAGTMTLKRDSGNVFYESGKFVLMGNFDGKTHNELWKNTLEKRPLSSSEAAYSFSLTRV